MLGCVLGAEDAAEIIQSPLSMEGETCNSVINRYEITCQDMKGTMKKKAGEGLESE